MKKIITILLTAPVTMSLLTVNASAKFDWVKASDDYAVEREKRIEKNREIANKYQLETDSDDCNSTT